VVKPVIGNFQYEVIADAEFLAAPGERPRVVCFAWKVNNGPTQSFWVDALGSAPPYPIGPDSVYVIFTQAELTCHLALGWPLPKNVIDLNSELRHMTSGRTLPKGHGLIGFLRWLDIEVGDAAAKDAIRDRIIRGFPFSPDEIEMILRYCRSDVYLTGELLRRVSNEVGGNLERALFDGEFSKVSAEMEHRGVPIGALFREIDDNWSYLRDALVPELDKFGIFVPDKAGEFHLSHENFKKFLEANGIAWPLTKTGRLSMADQTFERMTKGDSRLESIRQLQHIRSKMRTIDLAVGEDMRNRTPLWQFKAKTGRTQPAASKWVFSPAVWIRNLIEPGPGMALAYVDWSSMEFLVAAALSGDPFMLEFYYSGDPYLSFARRVGAAPADATKKTHRELRERYKTGLLAIQYGISPETLAQRLTTKEAEVTTAAARVMIEQHKALFPVYWHWVEDWVAHSYQTGGMSTPGGWVCAVGDLETKPLSLANWPVQATGGDILRRACVWASRHGLALLAPVHDAILIEAPLDRIDHDVVLLQEIMRRSSRLVLPNGHMLRTDAEIVRYPDHYTDERGDEIWERLMALLEKRRRMTA
jgi:DNA polymerase I-like protein with 3'-5' exonuclease and polymerase domains